MAGCQCPVAPGAGATFQFFPRSKACSFAVAETGMRYKDRPDVLLAVLAPGTSVAGVLTSSKSRSAPVDWCAEKLKGGSARAWSSIPAMPMPSPAAPG